MTDIATAILAIKPDAQVSVIDEDVNQITWHDGNPTNITNEQILSKQILYFCFHRDDKTWLHKLRKII